ncbi:MAG: ABC transporter substrate-binding protein [Ramlibacter sp.]|nr:ABC transporter substrate-binding protein [Ramlibacter sp.]
MKLIRSLAQVAMVAALAFPGGQALAQEGVTKTSILIGQSTALIGPGSSLAAPFHQGAKLYFDRINAAGGVGGRKIELLVMDDRGSPALTEANTKKLLEQGVLALFGYYGSPQVTKAYPLIKDTEVLLFAPMSAADEFRGAMYANLFSIRPGYAEESAAITRHAETLGARKFAIIHAADGESVAALDSAERTMSSLGANILAKAAMATGSFANSVDKAMAAKPESLLVIADPNGAANVIRDARAKGFRGPIYAYSNTGESLLAEELGATGAGVVVVRVVPKSENPKTAVVRELLADAAAAKIPKINVYMVEGYIAARIFTEALRRIPRDPTRARLRKAIEGLDDMSIGGFRVHFADDRVGSRLVELSLIDSQGKIRE